MKLLNLCCGAVRVVDDTWVNLDNLHETLLPGTPERANLDAEPNYVNHDVEDTYGLFAFQPEMFDGILASHCFEHWDCHTAVGIMQGCHRLLKPGGVLLVSVPDATTFRRNWDRDTMENAKELYGEEIFPGDGETNFLGYAGFNRFHKTLLSEDSLWCYFVRAGFDRKRIIQSSSSYWPEDAAENPNREAAFTAMRALLNRFRFSLIMNAVK